MPNRKRSQTGRTWSYHQLWMIPDHAVARLVVQLVVPSDDWWCHPLHDIAFGSSTTHDLSRLVARPYDWWYRQCFPSWYQNTWRRLWGSGHSPLRSPNRAGCHDWSYVRSLDTIIDRIRSVGDRYHYSRKIIYTYTIGFATDLLQSLVIAREIVRPIVRWPTTSQIPIAVCDRYWRS